MRYSIRWNFVAIICLVICLAFSFFALVVRHVLTEDHTQQIYGEDIQLAEVLARNIHQYVEHAAEVQRMIAEYPRIMERPEEEQRAFLRQSIRIHPAYELLSLVNMKGMQVARSGGLKEDRSGSVWFREFLDTGESNVSPVYYSKSTLHPVISLAQGIYQEGTPVGLVMADIRTNELQTFIESYNADSDCKAYLLDQEGVAIAWPDMGEGEDLYDIVKGERIRVKSYAGYGIFTPDGDLIFERESYAVDPALRDVLLRAMKSEEGTEEFKSGDGAWMFCVYRTIDMPYRNGRWTLALVRDHRSIDESMQGAWNTLWVSGVLMALLASAGGLVFAGRITRPLTDLIGKVQCVRDGNLSVRMDALGEGEVGILSKAFNEMLDGLKLAEEKRSQAEGRIREMAFHDNLTHLPNRSHFSLYGRERIRASMKKGESGALFYVDADKFKHVNDTFGHEIGDKLLIEFGKRLVDIIGGKESICRFGGDEFVVLLPNVGIEEAKKQAGLIVEAMRRNFVFGDTVLRISASVGGACYPEDADTIDDLLRKADAALYAAKRLGRDREVFYEAGMEKAV